MLYPQYFIDDLKSRADLVRVIEPHTELKKKGVNWMGRCPFHEEKTASFSVNPGKGFYKCFGCGKGGNVFTFLMEVEGLNFPEAIKKVAEMAGVTLPEPVDDKQYQANKKRRDEQKKVSDQIIELNRRALEFWEHHLQDNTAQARDARDYLESREISVETQRAFRVGYSPDSWDALLTVLRETGADQRLIDQSGLVSINEEKSRTFDRFRGRIMFPVLDIDGNPVAFGARAMGKDEPKYLNSPETPAYIKGRHLYGLYQGRAETKRRKFAILVEGYLDLIALYQFGVRNTAASLGTAFTPEQARLLGRFARKVVVNYDGDSAGVKAARRAIETLLAEDLEIKVLILPDGKDPDDFIRANGTESYNSLRGKAFPYLQFVLDSAVQERDLHVPKQKAEAIEDVLPVLGAVREATEKRATFDQAMAFLEVGEAQRFELWKALKQSAKGSASGDVKKVVAKATSLRPMVAEKQLLELLINDAELRNIILPLLEKTDYEGLASGPIFEALLIAHSNDLELSLQLVKELTGEDVFDDDLLHELFMSLPAREPGEAIDEILLLAEKRVVALREMAIDRQVIEVSRQLLIAQQQNETERVMELSREQILLELMRSELRKRFAIGF